MPPPRTPQGAVELPCSIPGWSKFESRGNPGASYFVNSRTGRTQWEPPSPDLASAVQMADSPLKLPHSHRPVSTPLNASSKSPLSRHRIRQLQRSPGDSAMPILADPNSIRKQKLLEDTARLNDKFASNSECSVCCGEDPECVCTICTCGNHRCPKHWHHVPYPNLKSEYVKKYKPWEVDDNRARRPQERPFQGKCAPDHWNTTHGNFVAHPPQDRLKRPGDSRSIPLPFDGTSAYREHYVPKEGEDREKRKADTLGPMLPFKGDTEYRRGFQGKPGGPSDPIRQADRAMESGPFEGDTEYGDSYLGKPTDLHRPVKSKEPWEYGPPRDLKSGNQEDYPWNKIELCPARILKPKKPNKRDGHCHYHPTGQYNSLGDPLYVS